MTSRGLTRKPRTWVAVAVGDGGATRASWLITEQVRCISAYRLLRRRGSESLATLAEVEDRLRVVLDLSGSPVIFRPSLLAFEHLEATQLKA